MRTVLLGACLLLILLGVERMSRHSFAGRYVAPKKAGSFSDRPQSPALLSAVGNGDPAAVTRLLDRGVSPDAVVRDADGDGTTPLQIAAETGDVSMVRLLLARGADVNATEFWGGNAVTFAASCGQPETLRVLIDHGGDVYADHDGATALDYALNRLHTSETAREKSKYEEVVRILRAAGAGEHALWRLWPGLVCGLSVALGILLLIGRRFSRLSRRTG